jgi:ribosomal protein S8
MNYQTQEVLKQIDHGYIQRKKYVNVVRHKSAEILCNFLVKKRFILGYSFYTKKKFSKKRVRVRKFINIQLLYWSNNAGSRSSLNTSSAAGTNFETPYHEMQIYQYSYDPSGSNNYISYNELRKDSQIGVLQILGTIYGFKTSKEAIVLRIGGCVLCKIYL